MCRLSGEWIANRGVWRVPMMHYNALLSALGSVPGVRMTVEPLPTAAHLLVKVAIHGKICEIAQRCQSLLLGACSAQQAFVYTESRSSTRNSIVSHPVTKQMCKVLFQPFSACAKCY